MKTVTKNKHRRLNKYCIIYQTSVTKGAPPHKEERVIYLKLLSIFLAPSWAQVERDSRAVTEEHSTQEELEQGLSSLGELSCSMGQQDRQKTCADGQQRWWSCSAQEGGQSQRFRSSTALPWVAWWPLEGRHCT